MRILGIYKCTFTQKKLGITREQLVGKVLLHLILLSIANNLNQFSFTSITKEMLSRLESEPKTKWEPLHIIQELQKSSDIGMLLRQKLQMLGIRLAKFLTTLEQTFWLVVSQKVKKTGMQNKHNSITNTQRKTKISKTAGAGPEAEKPVTP